MLVFFIFFLAKMFIYPLRPSRTCPGYHLEATCALGHAVRRPLPAGLCTTPAAAAVVAVWGNGNAVIGRALVSSAKPGVDA